MENPNPKPSLVDSAAWLKSGLGQRVYALEHKLVGEALTQVFGWQLLQIGAWGDDLGLMDEARTQRKVVVCQEGLPAVPGVMSIRSRLDALAIASDSVDAVLLPHTLEYAVDPHELLREVERILPGDGQLILLGFRPFSVWGIRNLAAHAGFPPGTRRLIAEHRIRDWLKLLGFEVVDAQRYLFTWPWGSAAPGAQSFLENAGSKLWPIFAGAYLLRARKRVYTLTPIRPRWRVRVRAVGGLIEPTTQLTE
ncbi:MAG: class I SAM-dependent methyltransferase [Steroidobacteraceae bacterium]